MNRLEQGSKKLKMKKLLIITDNLQDQINGVVTTYKNIEHHALLDGYHVYYLDPGRFRYVDCPKYNQIKIAWPYKMGQKIKEIDPDHIHIATEGPLGLCARVHLTKRGIRYNTAYHTRFPEGLKKIMHIPENISWSYLRWFHKHCGKILVPTESIKHELQDKRFTNEIVSWTRGVDRSIFIPQADKKVNVEQPLLVCVSRVSKEKSLELFFEMEYPNARKIMVGDGPMLEEYKERYTDVHFVGFKTGQELVKYYSNADVFVFPSSWETFGIVMIEAMACGTPVAAFPTTGPVDIIDQGLTGYMDNDLAFAVKQCLTLDRTQVELHSRKWDWKNAWEIFRNNLV
jgi:glycosyltransferase involved in cell wall biosynthesis